MLLPKNALSLIRRFIAIDPRRDRAIDVALRESIDLRFARIAYVNGKADNERKRRDDEQEVIELLDVPPPADAVDGLSSSSDDSISSHASGTLVRNNAASRVWRTAALRPQQHKAVDKILHDTDGDGKLLLVERTGGGKSLTMQMVLTMIGGIALIIVPLLALTADQVEKIRRANRSFGSVEAHHTDDLDESFIRERLIPRMMEISDSTTSSMYIFCSPQDLVNKAYLRIALLECYRRKTLRLVVIDEAHLYAMHGSTFREQIRLLHNLFFRIIFGVGKWHPLFLAMSATMTAPLVASLSRLTNVDWSDERFHLWASTAQFRQRNISIGFGITSQIGEQAIPMLVQFLAENPTMYACLFVNFVRECSK